MAAADPVNVVRGKLPSDYHCACDYCSKYLGELRPADGSYYSRLERRKYYHPSEKGDKGHIAKTPLHVARWAIQNYSEEGDWVLDPTIGAGTTAVEAITQRRSVAGMELEYGRILEANITKALEGAPKSVKAEIGAGDARNIEAFLDGLAAAARKAKKKPIQFALMVNNPPYIGDISMPSPSKEGRGIEFRDKETRFDYDESLPNIAFLGKGGKEKPEYWATMRSIYAVGIERLKPGGHVVIGIKDQMRSWKSDQLHKRFCKMLDDQMGLEFAGTALLRHHPGTLAMNTYANKKGNVDHVPPAFYQTINVFRKIA